MTVNVNTGVTDDADRLSSEIRQSSSDYLHLVDLDSTPFLSILKSLPSAPAVSTQPVWNQQQHRPQFSSLSASATSAATTIDVATDTGVYFKAGDLAVLQPGNNLPEVIQVVSVSTDTVTVVRSVGGVAAASAASGTVIFILGKAHAQGADITSPSWVTAASGFNYTQVFRHSVEFTGSASEVTRFGSKRKPADIGHALARHYRAIESTLYFGARSYTSDSGSGSPLGTLGGLAEFVPTTTGFGAMSLTGFSAAIDQAMAVGTKRKVIFCGKLAAIGLQAIYGQQLVMNLNDRKRFGVRPDWFLSTPYGAIPGFTHGDWHPSAATSIAETYAAGSGPESCLFLVDAGHVKYRPLRNTALEKGRAAPGVDGDWQEWVTEASLEVSNPYAHVLLSGITG